jgi:ribosome biogenesis GTPase A
MEKRMKQVDLVVEVRDARIPFSSGNPTLDSFRSRKPRLVVFNKSDLANANMQQALKVSCRIRETETY